MGTREWTLRVRSAHSPAKVENGLLADGFYFLMSLISMQRSAPLYALGDAIADLLIDIAPVFKRTL